MIGIHQERSKIGRKTVLQPFEEDIIIQNLQTLADVIPKVCRLESYLRKESRVVNYSANALPGKDS